MTAGDPRPELAGLRIADPPERWRALGFAVEQGRLELGGVAVELGGVAVEFGGDAVELRGVAGELGGVEGEFGGVAVELGGVEGEFGGDAGELGGVEGELGAARAGLAHAPPAGDGIVGWTLRHVEAPTEIDGLATSATEAPPPPGVTHPNRAVAIDHVVVTTPDFDRTAQALESAGMSLRRIREAGSFRQGFRRLGPAILELVEARDAPPGPAAFWGLVVVAEDLEALSARISPHLGKIRSAVQPGRRIATLADSAGLSPRIAFMDPEPKR